MFGLIGNVTVTPGARYNDDRADIAQLTCNAPGQQGFVLHLAYRPFRAGTEDNSVKGLVRACNVDLVYARVVTEVSALSCSSVHNAQESRLYESLEALFNEGSQVCIHRICLEQYYLVLYEQLVEYIHGADARNVSSSKYQGELSLVFLGLIESRLGFRQVLYCYPWLHPHFCRDTIEEETVVDRLWKYLCGNLTPWSRRDRARNSGMPIVFDIAQRLTQLAQIFQHGPRP